jgi:hypothetical protein
MKTKLNLKRKTDEKFNVGFAMYESDKIAFEKKARSQGLTFSEALRSLANDYIDGTIEIEVK